MSARAKIFHNEGGQAVRLPDSCRFADGQSEVIVRRVGNQVILEPVPEVATDEKWPKAFLEVIGAWKGEIPRPPWESITEKKNPFD